MKKFNYMLAIIIILLSAIGSFDICQGRNDIFGDMYKGNEREPILEYKAALEKARMEKEAVLEKARMEKEAADNRTRALQEIAEREAKASERNANMLFFAIILIGGIALFIWNKSRKK